MDSESVVNDFAEAFRGLDNGFDSDTQALACFNDGYNSDFN